MNPPPRHIAIIMDGNGRWAQRHGLPRIAGHRQGMDVVDDLVTELVDHHDISCLTLYAFSDENWERPADEVSALMQYLGEFLVEKRAKMMRLGVRLATIGDTDRLPRFARTLLEQTMADTAGGTKLTLTLALSYGARNEICRAVNRAWAAGHRTMTPDLMTQSLDTAELPDPDLFIRTSGEYRISNYLLWQMSYTELYFTPVMWPDFTPAHLHEAIAVYQQRARRFGRVA